MPLNCPNCQQPLYPIARLRPQPQMDVVGKVMLAAGTALAAIILFGGTVLLREAFSRRTEVSSSNLVLVRYPPTIVVMLPVLPVAIVAGVILGRMAAKRPKHRWLRCRNCGWSQGIPTDAVWESESAAAPGTHSAASAAQPEFQIIDDSGGDWKEATAWAWAELRRGQVAEKVVWDLIMQGWDRKDVEPMVEKVRREVRG